MPYFWWRGVSWDGTFLSGKRFALSQDELDAQLFKEQIALVACTIVALPIWYRKAHKQHMVEIVRQLASLVHAGILLPDALFIVALQQQELGAQFAIHELALLVQRGNALSSALLHYPSLTTDIMIQLIRAGEESGRIARALRMVADYMEQQQQLRRRIRRALMLPLITLSFVCLLLLAIFLVLVPYFASIIRSLGKPLPSTTQQMLAVTTFLKEKAQFWLLLSFLVGGFLWMSSKKIWYKQLKSRVILRVPLVNRFIKDRFLIFFFKSLAMVLKGGASLEHALAINAQSIENSIIKRMIEDIRQRVVNGYSFRSACSAYPAFFKHDVLALIEVGQETGKMHRLLYRLGFIYEEQLKRRLAVGTQLLQPVLMGLLGILVTLLILGVYMPLFNLSYAV